MKNLVIGQSGGPTAVINASLYGAVKAFKESGTDGHVLGMINGIEGFLADHVIPFARFARQRNISRTISVIL